MTTGNVPELIGHRSADEYIPCDYSDKEAVLEIVKKNGIEGIISCANDFGVLTAAYAAEQMGWRGHDTYETAKLMHHKDKFKQYCYEKGIPSVHSVSFTSGEKAIEYCRDCEYPVIVKANDLTGGKGIRRADNFEEAAAAVRNAFFMSRDKHILVEPYLTGEQGTFFAFLVNRKIASVEDLLGENTGFPKADVIIIRFETGEKLVVRPSGTEPKIKYYLFLSEGKDGRKALEAKVGQIKEEFQKAL